MNRSFSALVLNAGMPVRRGNVTDHNVSEVFLEGGWRFFDADYTAYFISPGSEELLSVGELEEDHSLITRSRVYGINHDRPHGGRILGRWIPLSRQL